MKIHVAQNNLSLYFVNMQRTYLSRCVRGGPIRAAYDHGMDEWRRRMVKRRKELRLTQEALAEALGVEQPTISGWESGRREPENIARFQQLASVLKCDPSWLVFGVANSLLSNNISHLSATEQKAVETLVNSLLQSRRISTDTAA